VPVPARLARGLVWLTWRLHLQPTPEGWVDMGLQTPLMSAQRIRDELGWSPARSAGDALLDLLAGFHEGAGDRTPPLRP
jgi:hypothetical protein